MRLLLVPALLCLAIGCVPKGKYLELETELNDTRSQLEGRISEQDGTIMKLQGEIDALEGTRKKLEAELAVTQKSLEDSNAANARMLKDQKGLQGEVTRMQQALDELERRKAKAEARMKEYQDLVARFQSMIDAGTLSVKIVNGRMVVELASDILFASGSSSLSKEGKDAIAEVATILASIPERDFQIEGHTDNVPGKQSNWMLGAQRAVGVVQHMIDSGMPPERISAASYAEFRPVDTNRTTEGKARNRRIEIVVVPDLSQLPGFSELAGTGE